MCRVFIFIFTLLSLPTSASDEIWFSPNNTDMLNNHSNDKKWDSTRKKVSVFKFYYQIIRDTPLDILKAKFDYLRGNNIKVAIEWPGLTWRDNGFGYNVEGFQKPGFSQDIIRKIKLAGGYVDYLALDEPIFFASYRKVGNYHGVNVEELVNMISTNVIPFYDNFHGIKVGDIEPINQMSESSYKELIPDFLREYKAKTGHSISFFHFDIYWQGEWQPAIKFIEELMRRNHGRFGVIFNSSCQSSPTYKWMISARDNIRLYMSSSLPLPNDVIIQSWNKSPNSPVGDSDPHSQSSLIKYYELEERMRR